VDARDLQFGVVPTLNTWQSARSLDTTDKAVAVNVEVSPAADDAKPIVGPLLSAPPTRLPGEPARLDGGQMEAISTAGDHVTKAAGRHPRP
jgi:hypothetical protein